MSRPSNALRITAGVLIAALVLIETFCADLLPGGCL